MVIGVPTMKEESERASDTETKVSKRVSMSMGIGDQDQVKEGRESG